MHSGTVIPRSSLPHDYCVWTSQAWCGNVWEFDWTISKTYLAYTSIFKKKKKNWKKIEPFFFRVCVPRSLQSWVSTIHTVVLTADAFQLFINFFKKRSVLRFLQPFASKKNTPSTHRLLPLDSNGRGELIARCTIARGSHKMTMTWDRSDDDIVFFRCRILLWILPPEGLEKVTRYVHCCIPWYLVRSKQQQQQLHSKVVVVLLMAGTAT